jgi:hypothetical protein
MRINSQASSLLVPGRRTRPFAVLTIGLLILLLLLGNIGAPTWGIAYTNVLSNPSFATGDLAGWSDASTSCNAGFPPGVAVISTPTLSPPPPGFPYSVIASGCYGLVKQTFAPVSPVEISFWAEVQGAGACLDAFVLYADGSGLDLAAPNLEMCNVAAHGFTSLTPWTKYDLTISSSHGGVVGIEVGHIYTGVGGAAFTDFQVLVPQQANSIPQFPLGLSYLAVAVPILLLMRSRYSR